MIPAVPPALTGRWRFVSYPPSLSPFGAMPMSIRITPSPRPLAPCLESHCTLDLTLATTSSPSSVRIDASDLATLLYLADIGLSATTIRNTGDLDSFHARLLRLARCPRTSALVAPAPFIINHHSTRLRSFLTP